MTVGRWHEGRPLVPEGQHSRRDGRSSSSSRQFRGASRTVDLYFGILLLLIRVVIDRICVRLLNFKLADSVFFVFAHKILRIFVDLDLTIHYETGEATYYILNCSN